MCFLSTIFSNAPAHPPPILFDQSLTACKANKPNITDHFHSFLAAKVDLSLANIEAEDLKSFEREKGGLIFNDYDGNDDGNDDNDDDDDNDNENNL